MLSRLKLEEGWFTLLLVWALVIIAAAATLDAELMDGLEYLPLIGTAAVLAGVLLAKSRFSSRTAHIFSLVYGLGLLVFILGSMLPESMTWQARIFDLVERQFVWVTKALSQGASRDGLIFVIQTSAVFWLLGYTAAWYTFRAPRVWRVVLPSGLVLMSVVYYYYGPKPLVAFLALYVLVALIYVARTHLVAQEKIWRTASVRYERDIRINFLQASFLVALLSLGIAWTIPTAQASTAVNDALGETGFKGTWQDFQDNWTRLFSSLRSYGGGTSDLYRDNLALGGPRTVGNQLVMDIYVEEQLPYVYWQAVAFDRYIDGNWSVSEGDQNLHFPEDGDLNTTRYSARHEVLETVINFLPSAGSIYGAPEIVNTDRQIFVTESGKGESEEISSIQSRFVMRQGDRYQVISSISLADATSLRNAPQTYPDWIMEKYLQMPDTITPETIALAEELTAGLTNPFDKAIAIRDWLRTNIKYNDQIQAPPDGVEPIDYVLFEGKEAYCNYYASSMAIMLRSQGIPARFVGGYAQGDWDEASSSYRVRSSNSHSWTEVFFPGYGWIQFEPTAALPAGDRPESSGNPGDAFASPSIADEDRPLFQELGAEDQNDLESQGSLVGEESLNDGVGEGTLNPIMIIRIVVAVVILGLAAAVVLIAGQMNKRVESNVEKSYGRLESWAPWLGVLIRPVHTPYERAALMASAAPEGKEPLRNFAHQFVRQRFSPDKSADTDFNPISEWKLLRPTLIRQIFRHQLQKLRQRFRDRD
ncbi:MAG: transglutaminase domain-containing protein [Candidatus Promineifilaceae bacterium]